jgi:hypothetical protein
LDTAEERVLFYTLGIKKHSDKRCTYEDTNTRIGKKQYLKVPNLKKDIGRQLIVML